MALVDSRYILIKAALILRVNGIGTGIKSFALTGIVDPGQPTGKDARARREVQWEIHRTR